MSLEFTNRICPNCKNPNYMVSLGNLSKVYNYKCMNCNRYFNDIDFEEPLQPVWEKECLNKKVDMVVKWIPCAEKLPCEKDGKVLISMPNGEVMIGKYSEFGKVWFKGDMCGVGGDDPVAWMPMLEPYQVRQTIDLKATINRPAHF